jgi:hypothetical protein
VRKDLSTAGKWEKSHRELVGSDIEPSLSSPALLAARRLAVSFDGVSKHFNL